MNIIDPLTESLFTSSLEDILTHSKLVRIASECKDENDKQTAQLLLDVPSFLFEYSNQELKILRNAYLTYFN